MHAPQSSVYPNIQSRTVEWVRTDNRGAVSKVRDGRVFGDKVGSAPTSFFPLPSNCKCLQRRKENVQSSTSAGTTSLFVVLGQPVSTAVIRGLHYLRLVSFLISCEVSSFHIARSNGTALSNDSQISSQTLIRVPLCAR